MNENRQIHLVDIPIGGKGGFIWNRLHGEREDICEAVFKDGVADDLRVLLQTRLRKIDDALDRLMAGSYGLCSKCGQTIDDSRLDLDAAVVLCLDCWARERGCSSAPDNEVYDVELNSLQKFDTILLHTRNSEYRMLLLNPNTGRALVEGGQYLTEPTEAFIKGSAVAEGAFKHSIISVGGRLEIWVDERAFITSPIISAQIKHNESAESVQSISDALH